MTNNKRCIIIHGGPDNVQWVGGGERLARYNQFNRFVHLPTPTPKEGGLNQLKADEST